MRIPLAVLWVVAVAVPLNAAPGQVEERVEPRFRLTWNNVRVSAYTPLHPRGTLSRTINLTGQLHLYDATNLAGVGMQAIIDRVEDQDGNAIFESTETQRTTGGHFSDHFRHSFGREGQIPAMPISASFPVKERFPTSLKRIVGRALTLHKPTTRQVKLALEASNEWTPLDDDLAVRLAEVNRNGRQLRLKIATRSQSRPAHMLGIHMQASIPAAGTTIRRMALIDDQGNESPDLQPQTEQMIEEVPLPGGGVQRRPVQNQGFLTINLPVPQGREYEAVRFDLSEGKVESLKFELLDVQLPRIVD